MEKEDRGRIGGCRVGFVKTELDCLPCFYGQITRTLHYAGVNGDRGREITHKAETIIANASLDEVPARTTTLIHRLLRQETGCDPYRQVKETYNRIALGMLPELRRRCEASADQLEATVRAAIAGNVIDFGIYETIDLNGSVDESFRLPLSGADYPAFVQSVNRSKRILYLCDNAGEIVFDRLLLEKLCQMDKQVTAVVKGIPVINDATLDDASAAGLPDSVHVLDNGNDGIGTLFEACSPEFLNAYRSADMIISKGQANYETLLSSGDERIFFLFKVKCRVVAKVMGREDGAIVLMQNRQRLDSENA